MWGVSKLKFLWNVSKQTGTSSKSSCEVHVGTLMDTFWNNATVKRLIMQCNSKTFNQCSFCTHLGIVLSFPCKILGALPFLSATDTPDELSVIHSIAAEPPNSGTDRSGALMESQQQ